MTKVEETKKIEETTNYGNGSQKSRAIEKKRDTIKKLGKQQKIIDDMLVIMGFHRE